ncbi:MAG: YceI family protein [Bacteriovoracaceae bacterium]|nr:YceI family protein [Bacteriovoracaceae bacterium]
MSVPTVGFVMDSGHFIKYRAKLNLFTIALVSLVSSISWSKTYTVTNKSTLGFSIYKFKIGAPVKGKFKKFKANIDFDIKTWTVGSVWALINVDSIDTGKAKRDKKLREDVDFFNTKKFKEITFISNKSVIVQKNRTVEVKGDLTIKKITRPVTLYLVYQGLIGDAHKFKVTGLIDRKLWKITWNKVMDVGGFVLGDDVNIELELWAK